MTSRPRGSFRVGAMRHRINLEAFTESVDTNGQPNRSWQVQHPAIPTQYIPTSGGETIHGKQMEAGIKAVFLVRHADDVYTPEKRISFQGLYYGIVYCTDIDGQRRWMRLECKAVNDND